MHVYVQLHNILNDTIPMFIQFTVNLSPVGPGIVIKAGISI